MKAKKATICGPDEILKALKKDTKALKLEAKSLQTQVKEVEDALEKDNTMLLEHNSMNSQRDAIKGKELLKLSRLKRMGFDENVVREHLEMENKKLEQLSADKRKERTNIDENIVKMKEMNEQSEKAVNAAELDVKDKITKAKRLKEELDEAEVKLYALESKVKYSRETKGVDIMNKGSLQEGIKDIVKEIRIRCDDRDVVKKVLKVAGRCLAIDLEMTSKQKDEGTHDSDSDSVGSIDISEASSEG